MSSHMYSSLFIEKKQYRFFSAYYFECSLYDSHSTALHYSAILGRLDLTLNLLAHNASTLAKNSNEKLAENSNGM